VQSSSRLSPQNRLTTETSPDRLSVLDEFSTFLRMDDVFEVFCRKLLIRKPELKTRRAIRLDDAQPLVHQKHEIIDAVHKFKEKNERECPAGDLAGQGIDTPALCGIVLHVAVLVPFYQQAAGTGENTCAGNFFYVALA
jgi:hypothetical protein